MYDKACIYYICILEWISSLHSFVLHCKSIFLLLFCLLPTSTRTVGSTTLGVQRIEIAGTPCHAIHGLQMTPWEILPACIELR